eukprot:269920-Lingulodinium_polyedra.AAC.1
MPLHHNHYDYMVKNNPAALELENGPQGTWATPCCGKSWSWDHCNPKGGGARRCFSMKQPDGTWNFGFFG